MAEAKPSSVKVAVRVRPMMANELAEGAKQCCRLSENQIVVGKDKGFTFDAAYDNMSTQQQIFEEMVVPLVDSMLQGYNATLFAYGQTGSGKTHTMGSGNLSNLLEDELGMIPRVVRMIFEQIDARNSGASTANAGTRATGPENLLRVSFIEIYNEELKDLLHPAQPKKAIAVRENAEGGIVLVGIKEEVVASAEETYRCLEAGCVARTTGSTRMNELSSRSHAIFTLFFEQRKPSTKPGMPPEYITSKFHLVDLAGSERNKRTGTVGSRFKESVNINYGLLALGNVISALGDDKKRKRIGGHVPYRESKLTRILQDSLGGNAMTVMVACVSPADSSFEETLNTLKYANRARNIKNKPIINRESVTGGQLGHLRQQVQALQIELMRQRIAGGATADLSAEAALAAGLQSGTAEAYVQALALAKGNSGGHGSTGGSSAEVEVLQDQLATLSAQHEQAKKEMLTAEGKVVQLSEAYLEVTSRLKSCIHRMRQARAAAEQAVRSPSAETAAGVLVALPTEDDLSQYERAVGDQIGPSASLGIAAAPADHRGGAVVQNNFPAKNTTEIEAAVAEHRAAADRAAVELAAAREELDEARADLARDERIFDEKMRQINTLTEQAEHLKQEKLAAEKDRDLALASQATVGTNALAVDATTDLATSQRSLLSTPDIGYSQAGRLPAQHRPTTAASIANTPQSGRVLASMMEEAEDGVIMADVDEQVGGANAKAGVGTGGSWTNVADDLRHWPTNPIASSLLSNSGPPLSSVAVAEEITELEEEKSRLLAEKTAIEEEKSIVETQANFDKRQFQLNKQRLEKTLFDLTTNIHLKEDLIKELGKSEAEARTLQVQTESRLSEMAAELETQTSELDRLQREFADFEADKQSLEEKNADQRRRMRARYEAKIQQMKEEVGRLQEAERAQNKLVSQNLRADRQIAQMQSEIGRMRDQETALRLKMKEDAATMVQRETKKERELAALRKEQDGFGKRIRELEIENAQQKQRLKRKEDELARRKASTSRGGGACVAGSTSSTPGRGVGGKRPGGRTSDSSNQAARPSTAPSTPARRRGATDKSQPSTTPNRADSMGLGAAVANERALDAAGGLAAAVEAHFSREQAIKRLEKELAAREDAIQERERALAERHALELRRMRSSQSMSESISQVNQRIDNLAQQQQNISAQLTGSLRAPNAADESGLSEEEVLATKIESELSSLRLQQEAAYAARAELEARAASKQYLSPEDEQRLIALEDQLETLDAQIEYKSVQIAESQAVVGGSEAAGAAALGGELGHPAVAQLVAKMAKMKAEAQAQSAAVAALEDQVVWKNNKLAELEQFLRAQELELDRQLTQQAKEHELKTQYLLKQINPERVALYAGAGGAVDEHEGTDGATEIKRLMRLKDEQIMRMEKDVYYYKHKKREMEAQVKSIVEAGDRTLEQAEVERAEMATLRAVNATLLKELTHLKEHLARTQGATAVRVSRAQLQQLRPMTADELATRRSAAGSTSEGAPELHEVG